MLDLAAIQAYFDKSPAIRATGAQVLRVDAAGGLLEAQLPFLPECERRAGSGQFHGGCLAAFIDTVGDFAVAAQLGVPVPTVNLRVDYLRPAFAPHVTALATVRRLGKSVAVVDIDVLDAEGRLAAIGRGTFSSAAGKPA